MTDNQESYIIYVPQDVRYPSQSELLKRIEQLENQYQFLAARHNLVAKRLAKVEGYPQDYETTTGE